MYVTTLFERIAHAEERMIMFGLVMLFGLLSFLLQGNCYKFQIIYDN